MKTASSSSSLISSSQRVVKPGRDLVGAVSFPQRVIGTGQSRSQDFLKGGYVHI